MKDKILIQIDKIANGYLISFKECNLGESKIFLETKYEILEKIKKQIKFEFGE